MDDEVVGLSERVGAQLGEVGGFGVVGAQEAIVALNGAFLPGTVGMAVVDGDMEEGFERVFVEELGAIIGEHRLKFMAVGAKVAAKAMKRGGHGGLRNGWKGVHIEAAGRCWTAMVGVDKGEDATTAAGRMDGVHLEMSGLGVMARGWRGSV